MAALAAPLAIIGTVASAAGTIAAGNASYANNMFQAKQYEVKAGEARAQGSRDVAAKLEQTRLAQSKLQAVSAADGGSATDPTVIGLDQGITKEGTLQALSSMATAETQAGGFMDQAMGKRMTARADRTAGYIGAATTIANGGSSLLQKYG